MKVRIPV